MTCLVRDHQYQTAQKVSGIDDAEYYLLCSDFVEAHDGRFPELDELDESNSEGFIKETLNLDDDNSTKISTILEQTGASSIEEATVNLNRRFKDKEITITPITLAAIVNIETKPKIYNTEFRPDFLPIVDGEDTAFFKSTMDKLLQKYGYKINEVNTKLVEEMGIESTAKAFVKDGNVYINTDIATVDSPVHELLHLFLGSLRFELPDLYFKLVSTAELFLNYEYYANTYKNRTKSDVNEEIFVQELAKHISGRPSEIQIMDMEDYYQLHRHIKGMLDTVLMGDISVKAVSSLEETMNPTDLTKSAYMLYTNPLRYIANYVQSSTMENNYHCTFNPKNAMKHRQLANLKESLMKSGELEEACV